MEKAGKMTVLRDVAKASGVSVATVSQVLGGGKRPVSAATREAVLRAAQQMSYHPNAMARSLVRQRTDTIGVVFLHAHETPVHASQSFVKMMDGIMEATTRRRQDTLMCTSYSWDDGMERISTLLDRRCDGLVLVVPSLRSEVVPALKKHGIPFVILAGRIDDPDVSAVDTDNEGAACGLVHHMIELGHRRIAFSHYLDDRNFTYCLDRFKGYQRAHAEAGIACDDVLSEPISSIEDTVKGWMEMPPHLRPTAIFGSCDNNAIITMGVLQDAGWRVPEDISVVGYDDIPDAESRSPGLTTIRQPLKLMGEHCVTILLNQIEKEVPPGAKLTLPTEFVVRGSLGPPP